ncbi:hypothetical protein Nmel_006658 [Mimus melanotis]
MVTLKQLCQNGTGLK